MDINGQLGSFLQNLYQLLRVIGSKKSCHILDAERVRAHILDLSGDVFPVVQSISVAQGYSLRQSVHDLFLFRRFYGGLQIADIVQAVKDTDNIDSIGDGFLYEILHHVVGIVVVSKNILAAEQHLQLGILKSGS